jgi:hypothetical protein
MKPLMIADQASLNNIDVTPKGLTERDRNQVIVFVPREGVRVLEIADGFVAERQLAQLVFGGVLLAIGLYAFAHLAGARSSRFAIAGICMATFGVIVVVGALRRGPHLRVTTTETTRKLIIRGAHDARACQEFLTEARRILGI